MGIPITWARMRPHADANLDELIELIEKQSIGLVVSFFKEVAEQFDCDTLTQIKNYFPESSKALEQILDFPDYRQAKSYNFDTYFEVDVITSNFVFPTEWRKYAYRTFLPDDLAKQLEIWQKYICDVKQGKFQAYLFDLYLYKYTDVFYKHWYSLTGSAKQSLAINKAWAKHQRFIPVRDRVLNFPEPYLHPAPVWSEFELQDSQQNSASKDIYELVSHQIEEHRKLSRDWNSRVPIGQKTTLMKMWEFAEFLDFAINNSWLSKFFTWAELCCDEKMGLFLSWY